MAEKPQGALEANFPAYVKELTSQGDIEFQGKKVELFNFAFLGVDFAPGAGVNKDLAQRLVKTNVRMYSMAFLDRLDELALQGKPPPPELTKAEFKAWCWKGQHPSSPGGAPQIRRHGGAQDRGNPSSKHSSGSAVDINYDGCPWMPVRKGTVHGGEIHKTTDPHPDFPNDRKKRIPRFSGNLEDLHTEVLWKPAFLIFDRANALYTGQPVDLSPDAIAANIVKTFKRFREFSSALESYFRYAFHPVTSGKQPRQKTVDEFKAAFLADVQANKINPGALHVDGSPLLPALSGPDADAVLQAFYDQIVADHAFMPRVTTVGKLTTEADGSITGPGPTGQRDPCNGVCNIRPEVVKDLVIEEGLRWGGAMFDRHSGDTMHFDLGGHFIDGKKVAP